jgi:Holliday junction resolvase
LAHFRKAKADERKVSGDYWKAGFIALRIPISGAGRFKGDVFAITDRGIEFCLIRRSEREGVISFDKREQSEVILQAKKIEELLGISVIVKLVAHFVKARRWKQRIIYQTDNTGN